MSNTLTEIMIYTLYLFYFCALAFSVIQKKWNCDTGYVLSKFMLYQMLNIYY